MGNHLLVLCSACYLVGSVSLMIGGLVWTKADSWTCVEVFFWGVLAMLGLFIPIGLAAAPLVMIGAELAPTLGVSPVLFGVFFGSLVWLGGPIALAYPFFDRLKRRIIASEEHAEVLAEMDPMMTRGPRFRPPTLGPDGRRVPARKSRRRRARSGSSSLPARPASSMTKKIQCH